MIWRSAQSNDYAGDSPGMQQAELVDLALQFQLIQRNGSWYSMGERRLGNGREAVRSLLHTDQELREHLVAGVRAAQGATETTAEA